MAVPAAHGQEGGQQADAIGITAIEELVGTFNHVCVEAEDGADARDRAEVLDGVELREMQGNGFSPYDQVYRYRQMTLGVLGYRSDPTCYVTAYVDPELSPEEFQASISGSFGMSGRFRERRDFNRAEWTSGPRRFMVEFGERNGRTTALLSLRNR